MSTLASWCHVVHSRDVSPQKFDSLRMSGLAFQSLQHWSYVVIDNKTRIITPHNTVSSVKF